VLESQELKFLLSAIKNLYICRIKKFLAFAFLSRFLSLKVKMIREKFEKLMRIFQLDCLYKFLLYEGIKVSSAQICAYRSLP
jgi:hypothetical protein